MTDIEFLNSMLLKGILDAVTEGKEKTPQQQAASDAYETLTAPLFRSYPNLAPKAGKKKKETPEEFAARMKKAKEDKDKDK